MNATWKIYSIRLCTSLLLSVVLFSCGKKEKTNTNNVFYLNLSSGNLESLDPAFSKELYPMWTTKMLYNTLVETDEHLHLQASIATRWEMDATGFIYTFHLRNDVFFQNNEVFTDGKGRRMTAMDVVYSFDRLMDPKVASPGGWIFNGRVREKNPFVAVNDSTLEIHLSQPFRPLPEMLSMPYCSIVPKEVAEKWGKDFRSHPCGTGPFQIKYWDEGNVLVLHKNANYWERDTAGRQLPYLDAVQVSFVDNKATEFLMFLQGKLDFVNGIDGSFKDLILSKKGELKANYRAKFQLQKGTYLNTEYLGFLTDTSNPVMHGQATNNRLVRQAINYAIDRKKIVTYFRNGLGIPAESGFIPAGMPGFDSSGSYGYHYNPKKSLELLAKAGFPGGKGLPPVKVLTPDNYVDIVNFVASQVQDVGIQLQVETMQPNILRQQMSRSQSVFFRAMWIADYPDAETYLAFFNSRFPAPPNYTRFHNIAFDKMYDESMLAPDSSRWKIYRSMDSLAMSYAPVVPLFYDEILHFVQNRVKGFGSNAMNLIDIKRVQVK
ncbi:ABC transporter substrate-binding protein [Taibaiella soli]|uniref:ABC transporter substrate-binding protein n=1 Tax=Taibaiella soli TaxID=1649169 RepID=UPI001FB1EE3C|nr:ABC transporter substrate-binding protein [Taibaiella soli]